MPLLGIYLSSFVIIDTEKSDSGKYTCIATNAFGRTRKNYSLQIQGHKGIILPFNTN